MALELPFVTLDVFTTERYKGNPLAIITIPKGTSPYPTQDQKQRIAREFNLSETVFVHEHHPDHGGTPDRSRHIDIFVTDAELPFAGHPTIGTATHLLPQSITTLITKAGPITIHQPRPGAAAAAGTVVASIPHDTHLHASRLRSLAASLPPGDLSPDDEIRAAELDAPIFSIVRGMTFCLVELPSLDALSRVTLTPAVFRADDLLDESWRQGCVCRYYFVRLGGGDDVVGIRSRMLAPPFEDPATGSAACALSSYLTLTSGNGEDRTVTYKVDQGVEMGRESNIVVEITTKGAKIDKVCLSGTATQVMRGFVTV